MFDNTNSIIQNPDSETNIHSTNLFMSRANNGHQPAPPPLTNRPSNPHASLTFSSSAADSHLHQQQQFLESSQFISSTESADFPMEFSSNSGGADVETSPTDGSDDKRFKCEVCVKGKL